MKVQPGEELKGWVKRIKSRIELHWSVKGNGNPVKKNPKYNFRIKPFKSGLVAGFLQLDNI